MRNIRAATVNERLVRITQTLNKLNYNIYDSLIDNTSTLKIAAILNKILFKKTDNWSLTTEENSYLMQSDFTDEMLLLNIVFFDLSALLEQLQKSYPLEVDKKEDVSKLKAPASLGILKPPAPTETKKTVMTKDLPRPSS